MGNMIPDLRFFDSERANFSGVSIPEVIRRIQECRLADILEHKKKKGLCNQKRKT